jgi:hypothetical protein
LRGVTPGKLILSARAADGARGEVLLEISGAGDVDGVAIPLVPPANLDGQVYLAGQSSLDFHQIRPGLVPLDADQPQLSAAVIDANGRFTLKGVDTGDDLLDVQGLPEDAYLSAARIGERDVLADGIAIDGSGKDPIEVLLNIDGGTLAVAVHDADDRPSPGARFVLVPEPGRRHPDRYRTAVVDENGRFTLRGIPPGDYTAFAWERIESNAHLNADFMMPFAGRGTAIHIAPITNPPLTLTALAH